MSKDEAINTIIQAWSTNALTLHDSATSEEWDLIIDAIEALKNG